MGLTDLKELIKSCLKIEVATESSRSECSYNERTYIKLIFDGEVISKTEIEKLGEDR